MNELFVAQYSTTSAGADTRDVAVVDDGHVGDASGPERLGVGEIDPTLGREAGVADRVTAAETLDRKGRLEVGRRADLLDQLEVLSEADDLDVLVRALDRPGDLSGRDAMVDDRPDQPADPPMGIDSDDPAQAAQDPSLGAIRRFIGRQPDPADRMPWLTWTEERNAGRIRRWPNRSPKNDPPTVEVRAVSLL